MCTVVFVCTFIKLCDRLSNEGGNHTADVYSGSRASLVAQLIKNPSAEQETWVQSLSWEDPLEKGKATHSSIQARRIPEVHVVSKSPRGLNDFHFFTFKCSVC